METSNEFVAAMKHRFAGVPSEEEFEFVNYILNIQKLISDLEAATTKDQDRVTELEAVRAKLEAMEFERVAALKDVAATEEKGKRMFNFPGRVIRQASRAVRCALSKEYNEIVK